MHQKLRNQCSFHIKILHFLIRSSIRRKQVKPLPNRPLCGVSLQ